MKDTLIILSALTVTLSEEKECPICALFLPLVPKITLQEFWKLINILRKMDICEVNVPLGYIRFTEPPANSTGSKFLDNIRRIERETLDIEATLG